MKKTIIYGGSHRYLSEIDEFKNELPKGVINKTLPDVGGTYTAANCDSNYIIICPFRDLVDSIALDKNNKYEIFKCYGGTTKYDFNYYCENNHIKKVAVTYDSFKKLSSWIENKEDWKVVVDEYHLVLQAVDYREDAINNLFEEIKRYKHYSFLSATPIDDEFEIDFLKNLPHYKVKWDNLEKIIVKRYKTSSVGKTLVKFINYFLSDDEKLTIAGKEVEGLFIFCNSVTLIEQICRTLNLNPDDVKISCANTNRNRLLLDKYEVEPVTNPNKKINFFTSKGFQGCNLFTNNGLIIVASDGGRESTLVDVSSTMIQITGRFRDNKEFSNCFRNKIIHLYSTKNSIPSSDEFDEIIKNKEADAKVLINLFSKASDDEKEIAFKRLNLTTDVVSIINGEIKYNELKKQAFIYKQRLKEQYRNGYAVKAAYNSSEKFNCTNEEWDKTIDIKMNPFIKISYQQLLKDYIENPTSSYEIEYPEFKLITEYLSEEEMNTLRWNKDKMVKRAEDKQKLIAVYRSIYKKDTFISNKNLKALFKKEFDKRGIDMTAKASLIEDCPLYDVEKVSPKINGKTETGYIFKDLKVNLVF